MPGILPMKVIRVGNTAQARIAQACDRCRSKKIRCDGVRPCCTQCKSVGFECKTSDKLSRRAFPRGYTESLEDRVRSLETEVRELKDLLDEKDEKIDMLSRIHSFSPASRKTSASLSPSASHESEAAPREVEQMIEVAPPSTESHQSTSSTSSFIETFRAKAAVSSKQTTTVKTSSLKPIVRTSAAAKSSPKTISRAPPRLLSDQYINIFFQEWLPLFPIVDRSSFLKTYQEFLAEPESPQWQTRKHDIAQLFLVFEIASLSVGSSVKQNTTSFEPEWRRAMQSMPSEPSLLNLQCHVLAQLLYLLKDDGKRYLRHRASGVTICHQLGLHLSQEHSPLPSAVVETRKRIFWAQYIVDRFGSSTCGVPMLLRDAEISIDLPGSTAQPANSDEPKDTPDFNALVQITRILSRVQDQLHPSSLNYKLSMKKISQLTEEVDAWSSALPSHLRLKFANDKPSTGIITDRSPLLSLAEFYVRLLINRPALCFADQTTASAALLTSANAAKRIAQICDLLEERNMHYTFPINHVNLLLTAGFTFLWQSLELPSGSRLVQDNRKSLGLIGRMLCRDSENVGAEFVRLSQSYAAVEPKKCALPENSGNSTEYINPMAAADPKQKSTRKHLQAIAARFSVSSFGSRPKLVPTLHHRTPSMYSSTPFDHEEHNLGRLSISSAQSEPSFPALSPTSSRGSNPPSSSLNLDYFPIGNDSTATLSTNLAPHKDQSNNSAWEQLLTSLDSGDSNIFNGIYGGLPPSEVFSLQSMNGPVNVTDVDPNVLASHSQNLNYNSTNIPVFDHQDSWSHHDPIWPADSSVDLNDIHQAVQQQKRQQSQSHQSHHQQQSSYYPPSDAPAPRSVISFASEEAESLHSTNASGEDFGSSNSLYSDPYSDPLGHSIRESTSISSQSSHGGVPGQQFDLCGGTNSDIGNTVATDTSGNNDESTGFGGIVIPNEYGIGF